MKLVAPLSIENPERPIEKPDAVILSHQRSGTHFLQASLASHPLVHGRGECVLRHERAAGVPPTGQSVGLEPPYVFRNMPEKFNLAIVMYAQISRFEALCSPLFRCKVIHLLRNPVDIAFSIARMRAAKLRLGSGFRAHYELNEVPDLAPLNDFSSIPELSSAIASRQALHRITLATHPDALTVSYEELTHNSQTNAIDAKIGARLLRFLGLPRFPLQNRLRKTPPLPANESLTRPA